MCIHDFNDNHAVSRRKAGLAFPNDDAIEACVGRLATYLTHSTRSGKPVR